MNIRFKVPFLRLLRGLPGPLTVAALAACASSHVLVGHARAPIAPEQVQVYLRAPERCEEIALIESSSRGWIAFTAQAKTDKVIDRLKREAASLGANGIVLQGLADTNSGAVGSGFATATASGRTTNTVGFGVSTTIRSKSANAVAIYVPAEVVSGR